MRKWLFLLAAVLGASSPALADKGAWLPTGSLAGIRADATATLLPSGKVLLAGGSGPNGEVYDTAELYDPATGLWAPTGKLQFARTQHTATLLPTGKVLVVGGVNGTALDTAELYDPVTAEWTPAAPLQARFQHTATLLPSGQVLVAGGFGASGALVSVELYDPSKDSWITTTFSLMHARGRHTATLLASGQVLVTGGWNGKRLVSAAEIYDGEKWETAGRLAQPRICHTATLLPSGNVLVAGGAVGNQCGEAGASFTPAPGYELYHPSTGSWTSKQRSGNRALHSAVLLASGQVLVAGGISAAAAQAPPGSEVYDWQKDRWQPDADLNDFGDNFRKRQTATLLPSGEVLLAGGDRLRSTALYEPPHQLPTRPRTIAAGGLATASTTTLLPSGKVLVAGGSIQGNAVNQAWIYDPTANPASAWTRARPLLHPRVGHTATLLPDGRVLIVGGRTKLNLQRSAPLNSVEIYDPRDPKTTTGPWSDGKALVSARSDHTATLLPSGRVLIAGGAGSESSALDSFEIYDPAADIWSNGGPGGHLIGARLGHAAVLLRTGQVLVAGGSNSAGAPLGSAELFDPSTNSWTATGPLAVPRRQATLTFLPGGQALLAGGFSAGVLAEAEVYDPQDGSWNLTARLKSARGEHAALLLPSGKVLFAGGQDGTGDPLTAIELYDPRLGSSVIGHLGEARRSPAAALLLSGKLLLAGGSDGSGAALKTAEIVDLDAALSGPRPAITSVCDTIDFGSACEISGSFRSEREASGGGTNNAAVNFPLVQLISLEGGHPSWLVPAGQDNFWEQPMTLTVTDLPPDLNPGWHRLTVFTSGRAGTSQLVKVGCGLKITSQPQSQSVLIRQRATFSVSAKGAQTFQWQQKDQDNNWIAIKGATGPSYTTPPIVAKASYQVIVFGHCGKVISDTTEVTISDGRPPDARVLSPKGGEYWPLARTDDPPRLITWSMSDLVRICKVEVILSYSTDGGASYPGGNGDLNLESFQADANCQSPDPTVLGLTVTSMAYKVPKAPPSGVAGSLYWIRLRVTNLNGLSTVVHGRPFYLVDPNPDSVRTLILANLPRMQLKMGGDKDLAILFTSLQSLASHDQVQGLVVDLSGVQDLEKPYTEWDNEPGSPAKANQLVIGIHNKVRELLAIYKGVKYLVLVGDDRIIPFARIPDGTTALLSEKQYTDAQGGLLSASTVGQALAQNQILSDNPMAITDPITADDLRDAGIDHLLVPNLAVGRLVETPTEITKAIATFGNGFLDMARKENKVLVTGYDFLQDSATVISQRWRNALQLVPTYEDVAPLDGKLLDQWTKDELTNHLCGNGGQPYAVAFLNGHATHDLEGVPGNGVLDIQGLPANEIYNNSNGLCNGSPLNLNGGVVFAVGCHGGLPVPETLDLPQTFLARGAVAYVANTGFGWGLRLGIGYAERLAEILAEEMSRGGVVVTGDAVRQTKLRYSLETLRLDPYDEKTLLQWTFFGLPMYAVKTGIGGKAKTEGTVAAERPAVERFGPVVVERRGIETSPETGDQIAIAKAQPELPPHLTRLDLHFNFSTAYSKRGASGATIKGAEQEPVSGCPEAAGCYYTLNGLATGMSDQPIQPYFLYDSRLAGTSQHGVLWKGGTFEEETKWKPVIAELVSNGGDSSDHGSLPPHDLPKPRPRKAIIGNHDAGCKVSDLELNRLVVPTGETLGVDLKNATSTQRRFTETELEVFYFNDTDQPLNNCDEEGPIFSRYEAEAVPSSNKVTWSVQASDHDSGVWRVVVVYHEDGANEWIALDLKKTDTGDKWQATKDFGRAPHLEYVLQAVDNRGNVSWVNEQLIKLPVSGVEPDYPKVEGVSPQ